MGLLTSPPRKTNRASTCRFRHRASRLRQRLSAAMAVPGGGWSRAMRCRQETCGCGMPCFADAEAASEDAAALPEAADPAFLHALHVRYFAAHLRRLPPPYTAMESSRMTCVYFCVVALDVLGALDDAAVLPPERRASIVEWVLAQLVDADAYGGFVGGPFMGPEASSEYRRGHSAMTYTALAVLRTLGAEGRLSPAQRRRVSLALPQDRGAVHGDGEADMRFVYTACASAALLGDWSGVDADATRRYVDACAATFDGGIALHPGAESHGGSAYTGTAALALAGAPAEAADSRQRADLVRWCVGRAFASGTGGGMNGRTNKPPDTCYAWWTRGTLAVLGEGKLVDAAAADAFVLRCQNVRVGGFGKTRAAPPDILHSFYSLLALSLSGRDELGLKPVHVLLGVRADRVQGGAFACVGGDGRVLGGS